MEATKETQRPTIKKVLKNPGGYARALLVVMLAIKRAYGQALRESTSPENKSNVSK